VALGTPDVVLVGRIVSAVARREMARAIRFKPGQQSPLPPPDGLRRLLYLHVPFCESLCPYCSFHRVVFDERLCRAYFAALRREIRLYRELGFTFGAAYVGGGTPTVLVDELCRTIDVARDCYPLREVSVETNPDHLDDTRLAALSDAGVNRLSVGVQTFDDGLLRIVNRYDRCGSGGDTARRLRRALGRFDTLNADMMFCFPSQDSGMLDRDIDTLLEIGMDQVTYYPLMVSDTTRESVSAAVGRVSRNQEGGLYRRIVERLSPGYVRSTAWCFSRQRDNPAIDEYIVDHDEYAGLGSGSIGFLNGTCYANTFDIPAYIAELEQGRLPIRASRQFSRRERVRYDFLMKLFSGVLDTTAFRSRHGGFGRYLWPELLALWSAGATRRDRDRICLTERGYYYLVVLMREFFTAVNNLRDAARREPQPGRQ